MDQVLLLTLLVIVVGQFLPIITACPGSRPYESSDFSSDWSTFEKKYVGKKIALRNDAEKGYAKGKRYLCQTRMSEKSGLTLLGVYGAEGMEFFGKNRKEGKHPSSSKCHITIKLLDQEGQSNLANHGRLAELFYNDINLYGAYDGPWNYVFENKFYMKLTIGNFTNINDGYRNLTWESLRRHRKLHKPWFKLTTKKFTIHPLKDMKRVLIRPFIPRFPQKVYDMVKKHWGRREEQKIEAQICPFRMESHGWDTRIEAWNKEGQVNCDLSDPNGEVCKDPRYEFDIETIN